MSDGHCSASRGVQAGIPNVPGRVRLGKQQWRDIRRASKLGAAGGLYSVELHGVKLTFRFQDAHQVPAQAKAMPATEQATHATSGHNATAQFPLAPRPRPQDAQRPRRSERKQGSKRTSKPEKARTTAGEDAGRASRAPAGEAAGAGTTIAQSPSACSPRRPNSRQRRSANRLVEFIRTKQAQQPAAAKPPQVTAAERPSPKRAHEDGVREGDDVAAAAAVSRRRLIVDVDYEARQEAAAALYTAWRQHTLSTTTTTSPKRALEHGAQEGDLKRGGGQRQLAIGRR